MPSAWIAAAVATAWPKTASTATPVEGTVRNHLQALVELGRVQKTGQTKGARYWRESDSAKGPS